MDDDELAEYQRLAGIVARHSARVRELLEMWLADPNRDRMLELVNAEGRELDRAMADLGVLIKQHALRPRLP